MVTVSASEKSLRIAQLIHEHQQVIENLLRVNQTAIAYLCEEVRGRMEKGAKILLAGNGGSAADCQHIAAEFVGRYKRTRCALPAIALTTDTSIITAIGNDFGFAEIFGRQVSALGCEQDILILISTSGNSENLLRAAAAARQNRMFTAAFLGKDGGALAACVDLPIVVPGTETARIQEAHILIGHILCEYCDDCTAIHS
ncbi:D-sedoheptulose 7-phosphate isomerase [Chryseolinea serpens]|uniref:D-sedoheptulose 7-phosphate isomerase n=1 Tax=Chryseolinea serpens TaxID=947013 RepID=A0A1M5XU07_9BACT|nr:SIS domain-containing protein [Chryseolinea serpens]SHI03305.1 D-sedoheptulose 7-phosphate isomerase [Chryseolinea serpens]